MRILAGAVPLHIRSVVGMRLEMSTIVLFSDDLLVNFIQKTSATTYLYHELSDCTFFLWNIVLLCERYDLS